MHAQASLWGDVCSTHGVWDIAWPVGLQNRMMPPPPSRELGGRALGKSSAYNLPGASECGQQHLPGSIVPLAQYCPPFPGLGLWMAECPGSSTAFMPGSWAAGADEAYLPASPGPWVPLTLSWDLETLPLFSTSSAVKAYQMDLSSSLRRAMAEVPARPGAAPTPRSGFRKCKRLQRPQRGHGAEQELHLPARMGLPCWQDPACCSSSAQGPHSLQGTSARDPGRPELWFCSVQLPGHEAVQKPPQLQNLLGLPALPEAAC